MATGGVVVRVDISGPLYDGRARAAAYQMVDKTKSDLADVGMGLLHASSAQFATHPTWRWESGLTRTTASRNDIYLSDTVPYTAWLEGTSRRNRSTSFRGFRMWRSTLRRLRGAARSVLQRNISDLIGQMGGR